MCLIIAEHRCVTCKYFDRGDNECAKNVMYLNSLGEYEVIAECDDWEEADND